MRVLAVTPYYPPEGGGLERYAQATLRHLAQQGHDVRVVATTRAVPVQVERDVCGGASYADASGAAPAVSRRRKQPPAPRPPAVAVQRRSVPFHLGNAPVDPALRRRLEEEIRSFGADVVVGHAPVPFPAEAAARAARRQGVPFVLTYHAGRLRGSSVPLDAMAAVARATTHPRLLSRSQRLIAVSRYVRDHALKPHAARTTIIPPGVDGRFHPGQQVRETEILFVGPLARNYRWKGVDVLWDAFEQLRRDGVACRLRLVGSGDRYEEFARRAAHRDDVSVEPRIDEEGLLQAYQRAGVVVLPSTTDAEAFGMVLAEANACGRPVVASAVGGIPDFVRHGHNGLLAAAGDAADLALRLRDLLEDPQAMDRMGSAGRRLVEREHDWTRLGRRTEQVLETAVLESAARS